MDNMDVQIFPVDLDNLLQEIQANVGDTSSQELDKELTPILAKLMGPGECDEQSAKQLFDWLVDPHHTMEEFSYAVGPLGRKIYEDMKVKFNTWKLLALGIVALEALAARNPILEGPWERTAWLIIDTIEGFRLVFNYPWMNPSDRLIDWLIHMMGDPNFCPSPYLRLEFMDMIPYIPNFHDHHWAKAFESILFALSALNKDDVKKYVFSEYKSMKIKGVAFEFIVDILDKLMECGHFQEFDRQLFDKMKSQVSVILHDVSYSYGLNPTRNLGSYELNLVTSLFQFTSVYAQQQLQEFSGEWSDENEDLIMVIPRSLQILLASFKKSYQTPQLIDVTASCVMNVVEFALLTYIALLPDLDGEEPESLSVTEQLLGELCVSNGCSNVAITPIGKVMIRKYKGRLCNLKQYHGNLNISRHARICSLLYHCNCNYCLQYHDN